MSVKKDLRAPFDRLWRDCDIFEKVFALEGEEFRNVKNRRTFRIEVEKDGFFVKIHRGVGWREIFKNLLQFKLPVTGAGNEYRALEKLHDIGVDTMETAAYGERNWNPGARESFLITRELTGVISLEDVVLSGNFTPVLKRQFIRVLATSAGKMHRAGINHRDCYICHYLWHREEENIRLSVIDLHRAQIRKKVPRRYLVKDVAGLLFSSFDVPLSRRDIWRFIHFYCGGDVREELAERRKFYQAVYKAACKLYRKEHGKFPQNDPFAVK